MPGLAGIHHVKIPVSDLQRSRAWYERVFGFKVTMEFPEDGVVRGLVGEVPGMGDTVMGLRENPSAAAGIAGFDPISFGVRDRAHVEEWVSHLDNLGIPHSPIIDATEGWLLVFHDPDGLEIHLYSWERHGLEQTGRAGYGRAVA